MILYGKSVEKSTKDRLSPKNGVFHDDPAQRTGFFVAFTDRTDTCLFESDGGTTGKMTGCARLFLCWRLLNGILICTKNLNASAVPGAAGVDRGFSKAADRKRKV